MKNGIKLEFVLLFLAAAFSNVGCKSLTAENPFCAPEESIDLSNILSGEWQMQEIVDLENKESAEKNSAIVVWNAKNKTFTWVLCGERGDRIAGDFQIFKLDGDYFANVILFEKNERQYMPACVGFVGDSLCFALPYPNILQKVVSSDELAMYYGFKKSEVEEKNDGYSVSAPTERLQEALLVRAKRDVASDGCLIFTKEKGNVPLADEGIASAEAREKFFSVLANGFIREISNADEVSVDALKMKGENLRNFLFNDAATRAASPKDVAELRLRFDSALQSAIKKAQEVESANVPVSVDVPE